MDKLQITVFDDNGSQLGNPVIIDMSKHQWYYTSHHPKNPDKPDKWYPGVRVKLEKVNG